MSEWTEQDSITLTAALVAIDGARMALKGRERIEAIRLMARRGLSTEDMALRLRTSVHVVAQAASRAGIKIPRLDEPGFYRIAYPGRRSRAKASQRVAA